MLFSECSHMLFPHSLALSVCLFSLCLPGYYFEIRSICAIRINTQVGLSSASDTADPSLMFLVPLVALTQCVETSTSICLHIHSPCRLVLVDLRLHMVTYLFCFVRSTLTCWDVPWFWQAVRLSKFSGLMCIRMLW